jgi:hypothetical protein
MSSISIDSICPRHGRTVHIVGAQISSDCINGTLTFSGMASETVSNTAVLVECGFHAVITPPYVFVAIEGFSGVFGTGIPTVSTALPLAVRPLIDQFVPVRLSIGGPGTWGYANIATTGVVTVYSRQEELSNDEPITMNNIVGRWSAASY